MSDPRILFLLTPCRLRRLHDRLLRRLRALGRPPSPSCRRPGSGFARAVRSALLLSFFAALSPAPAGAAVLPSRNGSPTNSAGGTGEEKAEPGDGQEAARKRAGKRSKATPNPLKLAVPGVQFSVTRAGGAGRDPCDLEALLSHFEATLVLREPFAHGRKRLAPGTYKLTAHAAGGRRRWILETTQESRGRRGSGRKGAKSGAEAGKRIELPLRIRTSASRPEAKSAGSGEPPPPEESSEDGRSKSRRAKGSGAAPSGVRLFEFDGRRRVRILVACGEKEVYLSLRRLVDPPPEDRPSPEAQGTGDPAKKSSGNRPRSEGTERRKASRTSDRAARKSS